MPLYVNTPKLKETETREQMSRIKNNTHLSRNNTLYEHYPRHALPEEM